MNENVHNDSKQSECARDATEHPSTWPFIPHYHAFLIIFNTLHMPGEDLFYYPSIHEISFLSISSHLRILSSELWLVNEPFYFFTFYFLTNVSDEDKTLYITFPWLWTPTKRPMPSRNKKRLREEISPLLTRTASQEKCPPFLMHEWAKCTQLYICPFTHFHSQVYFEPLGWIRLCAKCKRYHNKKTNGSPLLRKCSLLEETDVKQKIT